MKTIKKQTNIQIEGMTCGNCASGIKKHLESKGFENVNVNFSTKKASFNIENNRSEKEATNIKVAEFFRISVEKLDKNCPRSTHEYKIL